MRAWVLAAALAAVASAPALAKPYTVDKSASKLGFTGAMNGAAFTGAFRRWDAVIDFDPNNLPASLAMVTVDMTSAVTGDTSRDQALPSADWFSARPTPARPSRPAPSPARDPIATARRATSPSAASDARWCCPSLSR
jgi:polyisoprenoid-binding protein YceI